MSKRKVTISLGMTIQVRDYEYYRVDVGLEEELADGEDRMGKYRDMHSWVIDRLKEEKDKVAPSGAGSSKGV